MIDGISNLKGNERPLSEQAADQIQKYIIDHQLGAGAKMPNEFELAAQLNVGRGTIREAEKLLVSRNVLEIQHGRGTFVARNTGIVDDPLGFAYLGDEKRLLRELFQIRLRLEPWIAALAAEQATEEKLAEVMRCGENVEVHIHDMQNEENYLPADQKFHISIAACTDNRILPILIPVITYSVHLIGKLTVNRLYQETIDTHRKIMQALQAHDPDEASKAMEEHLRINDDLISSL
ncbi:MAG: FadR family transcriptional regulator [Lachnospiraceae bacterium]|nr:FadR family transcriptional regulator [Lachnospiraceae bacterium]